MFDLACAIGEAERGLRDSIIRAAGGWLSVLGERGDADVIIAFAEAIRSQLPAEVRDARELWQYLCVRRPRGITADAIAEAVAEAERIRRFVCSAPSSAPPDR